MEQVPRGECFHTCASLCGPRQQRGLEISACLLPRQEGEAQRAGGGAAGAQGLAAALTQVQRETGVSFCQEDAFAK